MYKHYLNFIFIIEFQIYIGHVHLRYVHFLLFELGLVLFV